MIQETQASLPITPKDAVNTNGSSSSADGHGPSNNIITKEFEAGSDSDDADKLTEMLATFNQQKKQIN